MKKKTVVIVGGGTSGLTIANNLQDHFNVVVLEKSKYRKYPFIYRVPLLIGPLYRTKAPRYILKREIALANGRRIPFFESNVLGGASAINGCVHTIGSKTIWNSVLSDFDSNYEELIDSYHKLYTIHQDERNKINLMLAPQNVIDLAFIQTLNNNRVPAGDMNFSDEESCGPIYDTVKGYFRSSVLSLVQDRSIEVSSNEIVKRVLFENRANAVGVETDKRIIKSDYVILCGGVIGTCRLLLNQAQDKDAGNPFGLLNIGQGVQDHTNLRVNVTTKSDFGSLNEVFRSFRKKLSIFASHFAGRHTLMVGTGATSGVHLDLNGDGKVDTRIQVVQFSETGRHGSDGQVFLDKPGFSLSITPISPVSRGEIKLSGDDVIVDPRYLSNDEDMQILKLALVYCLKLLRSVPLCSFVQDILNEDLIERDAEKYISENIYSGHHLIGGTQNAIDKDFSVKGITGLYVCDASILKEHPASNIHSSVVLMSDIFSNRFIARTVA